MAAEESEKISASEKKKEDWMNSKWRPMMGWMYMVVCFMDFVGFPILWSLLQSLSHGQVNSQWQPLTLQGAGLFHVAMGAVIGISAYGRTQEKLGGAAGPTMQLPQGAGTTYVPPSSGGMNNGGFNSSPGGSPAFGAPSTGGFGNSGGFNSPAPAASTGFSGGSGFGAPTFGSTGPAVVTGFGGKPAPVQPQQPLL
jgi:hypothetical protein